MREFQIRNLAAACAAAAFALTAPVAAQAAGKIVCWKDASGKTLGCGDTVPPEYRGAATKELNAQGVTRKTNESAAEAAKRRAEEQEAARQQAEEEKRIAEQRRRDAALIATFSNTEEIDAKKEREIQTLDLQITQQRTMLKTVAERHQSLLARKEGYLKNKTPVPGPIEDDIARAAEEKTDIERSIAAKEAEKDRVRKSYGEMKARYQQLRGGAAGASTAAAKK